MNRIKGNLLLITFDQWKADWTDPVEPVINLPCMQSLAERGLTARRCYTSSPQCVPARLSWLTGLAPSQMCVTQNCEAEITLDTQTIFKELQKQGWYTEIIGKTHWTSHLRSGDLRDKRNLIKSVGFDQVTEIAGPRAMQLMKCELTDEWERENVLEEYLNDMKKRYKKGHTSEAWKVRPTILPEHLYPDIWIANRGVEAIKKMPNNQQWLLWISFVGPHEPFDTPNKWKGTNKGNIPKSIEPSGWFERLNKECELRKSSIAWGNKLQKEEIEKFRADYADNLKLLDDQLLKITNVLIKRADLKDTAIAITADHGEMLGDHNMLYKGTFLESSIRVPFIYVPPSRTNQTKLMLDKPVGLTGLLTKVISNMLEDGKIENLEKYCKEEKYVTIEYANELVIIKNKKKLCCKLDGTPQWAINLRKDPEEKINIIAKSEDLLIKNKNWQKVSLIAKAEIEKRKEKEWIWRNLKKT